ncbi:MAG: hypothetical protein ACT4QC_06565 [Planctomycetaceae bacterium]
MSAQSQFAADLVDELRLRRWARERYAPPDRRDPAWPPIVLDEMGRIDAERNEAARYAPTGQRIVPLPPENDWRLHPPHDQLAGVPMLIRVPAV